MRCSAGMSSASAVCGGSGVSETISSTSWFSGSQNTRLCGCVGSSRSISECMFSAISRSIQYSSES